MYPPSLSYAFGWGGRRLRSYPHPDDRPLPLPPRQRPALLRAALVTVIDRRDAAESSARHLGEVWSRRNTRPDRGPCALAGEVGSTRGRVRGRGAAEAGWRGRRSGGLG